MESLRVNPGLNRVKSRGGGAPVSRERCVHQKTNAGAKAIGLRVPSPICLISISTGALAGGRVNPP